MTATIDPAEHTGNESAEDAGITDVERQSEDNRSVSRSAFQVGLGGLVSLGAGFASQMLIAALYGAGQEMDAYLTALTIPLYLQGVLMAGLSFVLIPAFVERIETDRSEEAWALVGSFFWLVGIAMTLVSVGTALFAGPLVALLAPGLSGEKAALAQTLLVVLAFSALFNGFGMLTVSVENARNRFFWPAAAGALNSIVQIAVVLLLYRRMGIVALAIGFVAASAAQAAVTVIPVMHHGWTFRIPLRDPQMIKLLRLITPFILMSVIAGLTPVLERYFASGLPDGDLSYLGYAQRITMIFQSLLGATIVTAIFPLMSKSFTRDGLRGLRRTVRHGLRLSFAVALPVVAVVSVIAAPLIGVLFERGAFDAATTRSVALVMPVYLTKGVLLLMVGNLLTRVFYVQEDTRTAPTVVVISVGVYLVFAAVMTGRWGYVGLAAAEVISSAFGVVVLAAIIAYRFEAFRWRSSLRYLWYYSMPALCAAGIAWLVLWRFAAYPALIGLVLASTAALAVFFPLLYLLDREIALDVLEVSGLARLRWVGARYGSGGTPN